MKNLLPADIYVVINQTILTEVDRKTLINLYEPIIGPIAVSLYLTLWADLDKQELISHEYNHHHLMTILKCGSQEVLDARHSLESLGLIRTFIKKNDNLDEYLYELYSPLSPLEFFNNPILSVLLLNNVGDLEYKNIKSCYKKQSIIRNDYEEITTSIDDTYKSVTPFEADTENIRRQNKLGINISNMIDFDLIIAGLPKELITPKTFNKKIKVLINQLAFIYNIDSLKMLEIIRIVIDDAGLIDKDILREKVRKYYEFNNNGSLPTIIYRSQPEYLKSAVGDTSNRGKMIYIFENTKPYDFLKMKNHGLKPSNIELKLLEHLAIDFELTPGVLNVLIDYVLRVNDGKLNKNYVETIASSWSRKNIKTVSEAMEIAANNHKKTVKTIIPTKNINKIKVPTWMNEENKSEEMSQEEIEELESIFKDYR